MLPNLNITVAKIYQKQILVAFDIYRHQISGIDGLTKSRPHDCMTAQSLWTMTVRTLLLRPNTYLVLPGTHIPVNHRAMTTQSTQAFNFYLILFTFHSLSPVHIYLSEISLNVNLHLLEMHSAVGLCGLNSATADCYRELINIVHSGPHCAVVQSAFSETRGRWG